MWKIILVGFCLVAATVGIHSTGTSYLMRILLRRFSGHDGLWRASERWRAFVSTAIALLTLHLLEIMLWAASYLHVHDVENINNMETAVYFSMVTFTTLGYGDITLPPGIRILSGIEAMNGVFLFGWSTALFFAVVQRAWAPASKGSSAKGNSTKGNSTRSDGA